MKASMNTLRIFTSLLIVAALLCGTGAVQAQNDAYTVEVAVFERSALEEKDAYSAGLRRVLLNNSRNKTLLNRDDVRQALEQAEVYVQAFSFRTPPAGTVLGNETPFTRKVLDTGQATQLMLVSFNRELVNQLITGSQVETPVEQAQSEVPLRISSGNSALVWVLIQDEGRDIFISDPAAANVQTRAREIAGAAGISLVYPAGDLEDQRLISNDEIAAQSLNADNLSVVVQKYAQETILVGFVSRQGALGWRGQWARVSGDEQQSADFDTSSLDEALRQGLSVLSSVGQLDETYRYGGSASSATEGLVWVDSIDSTQDYAAVMQFFGSIDGIGTIYPKEVLATSMVFSVVPRNALSDIQSRLPNWLQRTAPPVSFNNNSLVQNADLTIRYGR